MSGGELWQLSSRSLSREVCKFLATAESPRIANWWLLTSWLTGLAPASRSAAWRSSKSRLGLPQRACGAAASSEALQTCPRRQIAKVRPQRDFTVARKGEVSHTHLTRKGLLPRTAPRVRADPAYLKPTCKNLLPDGPAEGPTNLPPNLPTYLSKPTTYLFADLPHHHPTLPPTTHTPGHPNFG